MGTRLVRPGGIIRIGGKLANGDVHYDEYQNDRMTSLVGIVVRFHDFDDLQDRISIHRCTFERSRVRRNGKFHERIIVGDWVCYAFKVRK